MKTPSGSPVPVETETETSEPERTYQRDEKRHRGQIEYGIEEIARVRVAPPSEKILFPQLSPVGVVAVAIMTVAVVGAILFALSFHDVGF